MLPLPFVKLYFLPKASAMAISSVELVTEGEHHFIIKSGFWGQIYRALLMALPLAHSMTLSKSHIAVSQFTYR